MNTKNKEMADEINGLDAIFDLPGPAENVGYDSLTSGDEETRSAIDYNVDDVDFKLYQLLAKFDRSGGGIQMIPMKNAELLLTEEFHENNFDLINEFKSDCKDSTGLSLIVKYIDQENLTSFTTSIEEKESKTPEQQEQTQYQARKLLESICQRGLDYSATDVQIVLTDKLTVNYRVDKRMRPDLKLVKSDVEAGRRMITSAINLTRGSGDLNYTSPQSLNLQLNLLDEKKSSIMIGIRGEKVPIHADKSTKNLALHLRLVKTSIPPKLTDIKVDPPLQAALIKALNKPKGMILVSGPTSSGKTTLLGASMHHFPKHLTGRTLEDPVELKLHDINENITQMSVDKAKWDEYLMSILRQDPDLVLLGETRTLSQAETLLAATLTGHITVSTLHTNSAIGIIDRFLDMGVKLEDLTRSGVLELLVATRLIPKTCHNCGLSYDELDAERQEDIDRLFEDEEIDRSKMVFANERNQPCRKHSNPKQCACNNGLKGMVGVSEFIPVTDRTIEYIRENRTVGLEAWLQSLGWKNLRQVALYKVRNGLIDPFVTNHDIPNLLVKDGVIDDEFASHQYYEEDL